MAMETPLVPSCFHPDAHIYYSGKLKGVPQGFADWPTLPHRSFS